MGDESGSLNFVTRQELRNKSYGKVMGCFDGCAELEEHLDSARRLTEHDLHRLVEEESRIDEAYHEVRKNLEDFGNDVEEVVSGFADMDKRELRDALAFLFDEATGPRVYDAQLLVLAAAVRHKLNCIRVMVEHAEGGEERARLTERKAERELGAMREEVAAALRAFERLDISQEKLDERWFWGTPEVIRNAGGLEYAESTKSVRRFLKEQAPQVLPSLEESAPVLIEVASDGTGEVRFAHAVLEAEPVKVKRQAPRSVVRTRLVLPAAEESRLEARRENLRRTGSYDG